MKKKVIAYLHSHWDREWYREFEVFRLRLLRVFDNVLEMLDSGKIPSFYFDGQVSALLDYLEIRPEKEALVRSLIKQKKLFIGPFYCLVDEFLTDRITFEKNLEIGLKIAKDYGCEDFIGYFADTFGHSKNVPSILQKFGIDKLIVWRGVPDLPAEFLFCGLPTVNLIRGYFMDIFSSKKTIEEKAVWLKDNLDKIAAKSGDVLLLPIGADHLGVETDISEQIAEVNEMFARLNEQEAAYEIKLSNPFEYFELVKDNFVVEWNDELRDNSKTFILPGAYSSRIRLKQYRTEASYRLEQADKLQKNFGDKYTGLIEYAYKLLLQNQAHDSICGCSTDGVHMEDYMRYEKILQIANAIVEELSVLEEEACKLVENSGYEFKSLSCPEGFDVISRFGGFDNKILYDTQKIPVTEDYRDIYLLKKHIPSTSEVQLEISDDEINLNGVGIQFVRCRDLGDTYNFAPDISQEPEIAKNIEVLHNDQINSFCVRTTFFDVFMYKMSDLIHFRIEWDNEYPNTLWQVKFNLKEPVYTTYSEDMNSIIERKFNPFYKMRDNLPKERGIEAKTNFAPFQRYIGAQGFGVITKGLNEYEIQENSILVTLLRSVGVISNPKNPARTTPAGPPIEVPGAQQMGYNSVEFYVGSFEPENYLEHISKIYPQIM